MGTACLTVPICTTLGISCNSLDRPLSGSPGEQLYTYSNADVMIAGELVQAATGVSAADYLPIAFGRAIGFDADWWTDAAGNVLTYCCLDATPLNFARFGLLLAREGLWNGNQIIDENWINESTVTARGGSYGYFWWPAAPDGFAALGVHGQVIAIYPEDDLVVLRFGNYRRNGDGTTVRSGNNFHVTNAPENFDVPTFVGLVRSGLLPALRQQIPHLLQISVMTRLPKQTVASRCGLGQQ